MSEQKKPSGNGTSREDEETVQSLAEIHERHQRRVGAIQKLANRLTGTIGRPFVVLSILALILCWVGANTLVEDVGGRALDRFPFPWLELVATVSAFLATLLILTTQRHEQDVNRRRDQLTLHMAILTEKKIAKAIGLLEEMRQDSPLLRSRNDPQATEMANPTDPQHSLDRIEGSSLDE
ncbi:MAG: hypothetical protein JWQ16_2392 [Novosphingobium sp.]|nr:hypothetical protein [Novosphingobium sp.]